jgi:hypothetical protein
MHWSKDSSARVFAGGDNSVFMILFASSDSVEGEAARAAMKAAAPNLKEKSC